MNFFTDAEFNGGDDTELISLAIVSEDGKFEFYEVVDHSGIEIAEWVQKNVIPILNKPAISFKEYQEKLKAFLVQFDTPKIYSNHPNDVMHLAGSMRTNDPKPGAWFEEPVIHFILDEGLSAKKAKVPHNALSDARATRDSWLERQGIEP